MKGFSRSLLRSLPCFALLLLSTSTLATGAFSATTHGGQYPTYPNINAGTGTQAALIKKGEYLVKMGDCIACHTAHKLSSKPFAGGFGITTPFGTIYTPNITPDKKTGIGNWTFAHFKRALHTGVNPKGKFDYPAFPFLYFNTITDNDLKAIWAYLHAIPAVEQKNKKDSMMFPFNWRFLQLGWRLLFFRESQRPGQFKPNPKRSAQWNRGKYLVNGLGHCSMCHTRSYHLVFKSWSLAAPIKKYFLAGAFVEGFYAPNITSKLLGNTSVSQLRNVFLKEKLIGGGTVQGPMAEANHDSLKYLKPSDIQAIAAYLKTVKSEAPPMPKTGTGLAAGKKIFNQYCQGCHLTGAGGAPKFGDITAWAPRIKLGLNTLYKHAINGIGGMPAKGTCTTCTTKQIEYAVQYMVDNSKPGAAGATTSRPAAKPMKQLTLADGKRLYTQHCASCHEGQVAGSPKMGDKEAWKPLIKKGMITLFTNTINGYKGMSAKGGCTHCNDAEVIAAVKYMVNQSKTSGNYQLW